MTDPLAFAAWHLNAMLWEGLLAKGIGKDGHAVVTDEWFNHIKLANKAMCATLRQLYPNDPVLE